MTGFSLRGAALVALAVGGALLSGCVAEPYGYRYGSYGAYGYPSYGYGSGYGYGHGYGYGYRHHDDDDDDD